MVLAGALHLKDKCPRGDAAEQNPHPVKARLTGYIRARIVRRIGLEATEPSIH